jgi:hypothetical protein
MAKLICVVLGAAAVATSANAIFHFILTRWFDIGLMFPSETRNVLTPMPVADVILFSVIFALGAGVVFLMVTQVAHRPVRTYLLIAAGVLFLSFLLPLKIPSPPVAIIDKVSLVAMHIVGAVAVVSVLIGLGRHSGGRRGAR